MGLGKHIISDGECPAVTMAHKGKLIPSIVSEVPLGRHQLVDRRIVTEDVNVGEGTVNAVVYRLGKGVTVDCFEHRGLDNNIGVSVECSVHG